MKKITVIYIIIALVIGFALGGLMMKKTQTRSLFALNSCENTCLGSKDILGLLASIGIQNLDLVIPNKIAETDQTIVIENPFPEADIHYLVLPKKDIKDIGQLDEENIAYVDDAYKVMNDIIVKDNLVDYKIVTYGPGYQHATYLHFHLMADK